MPSPELQGSNLWNGHALAFAPGVKAGNELRTSHTQAPVHSTDGSTSFPVDAHTRSPAMQGLKVLLCCLSLVWGAGGTCCLVFGRGMGVSECAVDLLLETLVLVK